jgi:hypothetical protein
MGRLPLLAAAHCLQTSPKLFGLLGNRQVSCMHEHEYETAGGHEDCFSNQKK